MQLQLTPDVLADLDQITKAVKSIPDIMLNVALKVGLAELKNVLELMPDQTKKMLIAELQEAIKGKT